MPKLLCTLLNASSEINGVTFQETPAGMLSEEVSQEVADYLAKIPGYEILGNKAAKAAEPDAQKDAAAAAAAASATTEGTAASADGAASAAGQSADAPAADAPAAPKAKAKK